MIIQTIRYSNLIYATIIIFFLLIVLVFYRALVIKNKRIKKINIEENENSIIHQERLFRLIEIDTPSFSEGENYNKFKTIIEEQFPLIHKFLEKEKVGGNTIYSYKSRVIAAPSVLFASHIDYIGNHIDAYKDNSYIYGNGTFDSKSLVYVIFETVEAVLLEKEKLDINLTIVITNDDEAKKDGLSKIINLFLKRGNFFNLVVEEGSGIIDSEVYGLKSTYALVGLGVSGQVQLRFEASSDEYLHKFIQEINKPKFFKMKVDNKSIKVLSKIAKDMNFKDRFFLNNSFIFKRKAKKIVEVKYHEIEKMLKTNLKISNINYFENKCYVDVIFELSTHEKAADILIHLDDMMTKFKIDYKILNVINSSKITRTSTYGYNFIKKAINDVFKNLYIAPIIVTNISERRYFDRVSDCVIRFSPLYYDFESFKAANSVDSRINSSSLESGINFYKYILNNYNKKR